MDGPLGEQLPYSRKDKIVVRQVQLRSLRKRLRRFIPVYGAIEMVGGAMTRNPELHNASGQQIFVSLGYTCAISVTGSRTAVQ